MEEKICIECEEKKDISEFPSLKGDHTRSQCKTCYAEYKRNLYSPEDRRRSRLKTRYGLTQEQFLSLSEEQDNRCAICGVVPDDVNDLCVDHDHSCCPGRNTCGLCIRGLLCNRCNRAIGMFEDNDSLLISAARYLQEYKND